MWKTKPAAGVDDLDEKATVEGDGVTQPVTLKYEDSAQYQVGACGSCNVWCVCVCVWKRLIACDYGQLN